MAVWLVVVQGLCLPGEPNQNAVLGLESGKIYIGDGLESTFEWL